MITHAIATIEDFLIMDGFSMERHKTLAPGYVACRKYPNPQPSPLTYQLAKAPESTLVTRLLAASVYSYTVARAVGSNRSLCSIPQTSRGGTSIGVQASSSNPGKSLKSNRAAAKAQRMMAGSNDQQECEHNKS